VQNNQSKNGWRHGSSGRAPVSQAQSLEFKAQYHQKKINKSAVSDSMRHKELVLLWFFCAPVVRSNELCPLVHNIMGFTSLDFLLFYEQ
jgi:hypothetical protein